MSDELGENDTVDLGFRPRKWQAECYRALKRFSVLVVHRRAGKTLLAVMKLIDAALKDVKDAPRYAYMAPLFKQAKDVAWTYLRGYARRIPGAVVNESETWIEFPNGARVRIYGADNPDALRGLYLDGVVMDEVAQMKPDVWDEIVLPTLADRGGWAMFIGTPKGVNRFSELYDSARTKPDWFACLIDVNQTDALPESEIEMARREMSEAKFKQEYLCDFSAASENTLIPLELCMAARMRKLMPAAFNFAPRTLGVDVARQGDDSTVIQRRQGLMAFDPIVIKDADLMRVAARVVEIADKFESDTIFVDGTGGYGAGVIDRMRMLGYRAVDVQFGAKPDDPKLLNKRAEMYLRVKDWLQAGGKLPDDTALMRELSAVTYSHDNARGVMQLESKDDLRERIGASPDRADALALTFAYASSRGTSFAGRSKPAVAALDFNIFD